MVTNIHHKKSWVLYKEYLLGDIIIIVVNILIDLKILLILATCKLKIAQSIGCSNEDNGG